MPTKQRIRRKTNNLNFIATYLFENPGCSATEVRKALWIYKHKKLCDSYNPKKSYTSYFQIDKTKSHRGYCPKFWKKINRCRWVLTSEGLSLVEKKLIKHVKKISLKL